jgi:hypothetical protein
MISTGISRLVFTDPLYFVWMYTGFLDKWMLGVVSKGDATFSLDTKIAML